MADDLRIPDETPIARARRRWAALKNARTPFEAHWRDLGDHLLPRRQRWEMADKDRDARSGRIINSTPVLALRTLMSGMMSGITSPSRPWFKLSTPDKSLEQYGPVKAWLHDVATRLHNVFNRTNLYAVLPNIYREQGAFGISGLTCLDDDETLLRFGSAPMGSYWVTCDARGRVDTFYRRMTLTVRQIATEFGLDNISTNTKNAIRSGDLDSIREVLHVVEPNRDYDPTLFMSPKGKRWRSCYYETASDDREGAPIMEQGFDAFPMMCPRWDTTSSEEAYGNSPGMEALGDMKALQLQERRKAQAIDKHVDPPMVAAVSLKNSKVSLLPGDVTFVDTQAVGGAGFKPAYEIKPEIQALMMDIQAMEGRIKRAFFEDLFLMISMGDQTKMTATEIAERHEEKLLALGPVLERQNADLLDPLVDRAFTAAARAGKLPPPPQELSGVELKVEYISILHAAQRAVMTGSIERFSAYVGQIAAIKPDVLDKFDGDAAVDAYGEALGVPPKIVRSDDEVQDVRAQSQKMKMAQMAAASAPAIKQGVDAAATAATTQPQQGNLLQNLAPALANIPGMIPQQ